MKAVVSVIGKDQRGIISGVSTRLYEFSINVQDISQTIMHGYFTMIMLVDVSACEVSFSELADQLERAGTEQSLSIRIQREDIFNAMHRI